MLNLMRASDEPDIYIISYPKTGRTWVRTLIGKALVEHYNLPEKKLLKTKYLTAAAGLPRTQFSHDGSKMAAKTPYTELLSDKSRYKDKKVVLLTRDIKDTLVSAYFQATKRIHVFDGHISQFIRSDLYGAQKILTFYKIWHDNQTIPKEFLRISYEDLHQDPVGTLIRILRFIGANDIEEPLARAAVEFSSFDNLKKMESEDHFKSSRLKPRDISDPESFKVRKGKIGNYTEYLSEDDIGYINELIEQFDLDL